MWIWVFGLLVALVVGSFIGAQRLSSVEVRWRLGIAISGVPIWMHARIVGAEFGALLVLVRMVSNQANWANAYRLAEDIRLQGLRR